MNCYRNWQECAVFVLAVISLGSLFLFAPGCTVIVVDSENIVIDADVPVIPPPHPIPPQSFKPSLLPDDRVYRGASL